MLVIKKLDGNKFAKMIISGANNLYNNKQTVDDLNVFPVPDGDTGTNMSLTAMAMVDGLKSADIKSISKAADIMAYATLRGARGNSGVILSQFFRGISKNLKGKDSVTPAEFADALEEGSKAAYKAVMKPTEGTILTVSREAALGAIEGAKSGELEAAMLECVTRGNEALLKTTQMLPALQEAGVVDAGGQGWMFVLEGALSFLKTGKVIKSKAPKVQPPKKQVENAQAKVTGNIKFKYCTEFIIEKKRKGTKVDNFRETIKPKGNCMLVIDDDDVVKVHIHTNHPGFVLEEAVKLGEIINLKVDNMKRQHHSLINNEKEEETKTPVKEKKAVTTKAVQKKETPKKETVKKEEPKKRLSKKEELKEFGFVSVCAGRGMADILTNLGVDKVVEGGQSMNPSTHDIVKAITRVKAKTVFVFPNNKNIIMAANQAIDLIGNKKVIVIPSVNIPQCIRALMDFNPNKDTEYNEKRMTKALAKVKAGQITYAVRNTEIDGKAIKKGDILGLFGSDIEYIRRDLDDVLVEMIADSVDEDTEYVTVYYGKDVKRQTVQRMEKLLSDKYADDEIEVSFKRGGQPLYYYIISVE